MFGCLTVFEKVAKWQYLFSKKYIQYSQRKTWMADVKVSNWNITTNAAILKEKNYKS